MPNIFPYKQIVNRARAEAANYKRFYGSLIPAKILSDRVASYTHLFSLYWALRPFGAAILLACYDLDGPALYMIEPSGSAFKYHGTALGKGRQTAKTELEKLKLSDMTCREAVMEIARIIYSVHDEVKEKGRCSYIFFYLVMNTINDEVKEKGRCSYIFCLRIRRFITAYLSSNSIRRPRIKILSWNSVGYATKVIRNSKLCQEISSMQLKARQRLR